MKRWLYLFIDKLIRFYKGYKLQNSGAYYRIINGVRVKVYGPQQIYHQEKFSIGEGCSINDMVYINAMGGIDIGDNVRISAGAMIISAGIDTSSQNIRHEHTAKPIRIGNFTWVGAGAIILPGVTIGDNVVVGAGAVVTKDVESGTKVAGVPAREIISSS